MLNARIFQNVISYLQKCLKNARFYSETLEHLNAIQFFFTTSSENKRLISQSGLDFVLFQNASIFYCQSFYRTKILKVFKNTTIIYKGLEFPFMISSRPDNL